METTNLKRHISEVSAHFDSIKIVKLFDFVAHSDYSEVEHHTRDIHSLYQEATDLHKHLMNIENDLRELYHIEVGKKFKDAYEEIAEVIKDISFYQDLLNDFLKERRKNCRHDWVEQGHDSHYDYYKCRKCGKEERWY